MQKQKISRIRTGGQTGVDRAAMDTAREYGLPLRDTAENPLEHAGRRRHSDGHS